MTGNRHSWRLAQLARGLRGRDVSGRSLSRVTRGLIFAPGWHRGPHQAIPAGRGGHGWRHHSCHAPA